MKTTTYKKVSLEKLARVLPRAFSTKLPSTISEPVTAVVFRDEVVTGRIVRKAVEHLGDELNASLILVGRDFTREATDFATTCGATVISDQRDGGYDWSDQRLADIRTAISTHRPLSLPSDAELNAVASPNKTSKP